MNDSKNLNENVTPVANTPYEETVNKPEVSQTSDKILTGKVVIIGVDTVNIKFDGDEDEEAIIP